MDYTNIRRKYFQDNTFSISRLGVPIFLLLTGYLTLSKEINSDEDVKKFYKRNLLPIVITTEIWIVLYTIFIWMWRKQEFNYIVLIKRMLFLDIDMFSNMWYMPMIIGMYIAIPFLSKIVKTYSMKSLKFPIIIVLILSKTPYKIIMKKSPPVWVEHTTSRLTV